MARSTTAMTLLVALVALSAATGVSAALEMHGSGTSNPSKFFWKVMDILEERAKEPISMTYRSVGAFRARPPTNPRDASPISLNHFSSRWSATRSTSGRSSLTDTPPDPFSFQRPGSGGGQSDFTANRNHFGSGDIPFESDDWTTTKNGASGDFFHIPFVVGGISFFYNIPGVSEIDLDACTLSGIFLGEITRWNDPKIKALNPGFDLNQPITVLRREGGSSSTGLITKYLNLMTTGADANCDATPWPASKVGSTWAAAWDNGHIAKDNSGGIAEYLEANPYTIAYLDSGHGREIGASEVSVKNAAGNYVVSDPENVQAAAASYTALSDFTADWSAQNILNQAGENTWPISTFSYLYIRKDFTAALDDINPGLNTAGAAATIDKESAWLVKAFAEFVLSEEGQNMLPDFGFVKMPTALLTKAKDELARVTWPAAASDRGPWIFEGSKNKDLDGNTIVGMGDRVFSKNRKAFADHERGVIMGDIALLKEQIAALSAVHPDKWYEDPAKQIEAAAAVGALGFIFGFVSLIIGAVALSRANALRSGGSSFKGGMQI